MTPDQSPNGGLPPVPAASPPSAARSTRSGTSPFRSPPDSALRRSPRYSPYRDGISYCSPSSQRLDSPPVIRAVTFSPQPRATTPSRPPRSPAPLRPSRVSPVRTGRPRDDIWQHYYIERENGKKHGRCKYCGTLKKNGKPGGNLLKHLVNAKQCPSVPRDVQIALRPKPVATDFPATSDAPQPPPPSDLTQDAFEMALARLFFVCALPFVLVEARIFREFMALLAPMMKVPSRHKLSGVLLDRVRKEVHLNVLELINKQDYVSLVTDGWSDITGASIINFMVVAPGMPSLFWSSWPTQSEQHTAVYLAGETEKVLAEIESTTSARVISVVTDNAKNVRSASSHIQNRRPNVVTGGCSAHVLILLIQDVCRFPIVTAIQKRAVDITRFVRDHLALLDEFKRHQREIRNNGLNVRNLVLPVPTRWYSVFACLRSVLNSQDILEKLFLSPEYEQFRDRYRGTSPSRKKLAYIVSLVRDIEFWSGLRTVVRLVDPLITALKHLESGSVFVSGVYRWFRWLRYHSVYGVTSPEDEEEKEEGTATLANSTEASLQVGHETQDGIELLSDAACSSVTSNLDAVHGEHGREDREYTNIGVLPLDDLQTYFRSKIKKRWSYVHTNAMGIAFMLDPSMDLDDFVGNDDEEVEDQACKLAQRCDILTPNAGVPKLTAEILAFKSMKRRGGSAMRERYSESSPRDYWESRSAKEFPLLKQIARIVFAVPTSSAASERAWSIFEHIHSKRRNRLSVEKVEKLAYIYINYGSIRSGDVDLARHQSRPESIE